MSEPKGLAVDSVMLTIAQVTEVTQAAENLLSNRSESLVVIVVGMVLIGVVMWFNNKRQDKEDEYQQAREKHYQEINARNADAMDRIGDATEGTAKAVELIATQGEQTVKRLDHIDLRLAGVEKAFEHTASQIERSIDAARKDRADERSRENP